MAHTENIIGLDLGSSTIRVAVGQNVYGEESKIPKLHIVSLVEVESEGINRGVITNIDDAVRSVSKALDQAERVSGVPIESAWIGINGAHINGSLSRGIVAVAKPNGDISEDDVERAIEAARTVGNNGTQEILHVMPRRFMVDGKEGVKDPMGLQGMRLEVDAYLISGISSQIKNLTKCIYQTGLDIEDIVVNGLASAEAVLTSKQKELGVAAINIGSSTTTVAVYEQGELLHYAVVPIGSEHITSDIAIGLRTSIDVAEAVKIRYGCATLEAVDKKEEIELSLIDSSESAVVSKKYVYEIIEARIEEIFKKVDAELKKIERNAMLPAGVVLTGGGSKLPRITEVAKQVLRLPAALGYPLNISSVIDSVNDLGATTVIGLVKWGAEAGIGSTGMTSKFKSVTAVTSRMKKWMKTLMP